jgi:nitroimidazol reductase NimA-like FMN-containing flavoprotein (pyridoxamine 5'-phosphate oxidase superfamily)
MTQENLDATNNPTPFGKGVKQRDLIKMTPEEIEAFLFEWHTMNIATINHDNTIHLVAMWYGFIEGCPALETKAKSQKVNNLRRNPQITCLIEEGDSYDQLRGVEMVGHAEIVEDPDRIFTLGVSVFERTSGAPYTEEMRPAVEMMINKRVAIKIHIDKYVSWDHRKLGLPSMG